MTAEMAANCPTCNPSALRGLPTVTPQEAAKVLAAEARQEWADQCSSAEAMGQQLKNWDQLSYLEKSRMVSHKFAAALRAISEDSHE
ncbi:hypothetical protein [Sulfitobacter sp. M23508]|uniref:hypothetical protein n=1 Tax=Sulfitobacter sp. M23508 TaxID=3368577 RepID=UPI0037454C38